MTRTALSLSPLFRSTIGFDKFDELFESVLNAEETTSTSYPPYNIERKGEDDYTITMAIAGFGEEDITIQTQNNELIVSGKIEEKSEDTDTEYLHKGIATRAFERSFKLADHMIVTDADLSNGLLKVNLVREIPEEKKPRLISINGGDTKKLENKKSKK